MCLLHLSETSTSVSGHEKLYPTSWLSQACRTCPTGIWQEALMLPNPLWGAQPPHRKLKDKCWTELFLSTFSSLDTSPAPVKALTGWWLCWPYLGCKRPFPGCEVIFWQGFRGFCRERRHSEKIYWELWFCGFCPTLVWMWENLCWVWLKKEFGVKKQHRLLQGKNNVVVFCIDFAAISV